MATWIQLVLLLICTEMSVQTICCNSPTEVLSKVITSNQELMMKTILDNQATLMKTTQHNQETLLKMIKDNQQAMLNLVEMSKQKDSNYPDCSKPTTTAVPEITTPTLGSSPTSAGKSCGEILESGHSNGTGLYWIRPDGESYPSQTLCDMTFNGGGWSLASYGYISSIGYTDKKNKNIPNMNHPDGYNWTPSNRQRSNGVINLQHGAVYLARQSTYMLMAGGGLPNDIDDAKYVYKINISSPYDITFANHGRIKGSATMHLKGYTILALKGETGHATRYALAESLGITWSDSHPTGYGFSEIKAKYGLWTKGPFFPSIHTGDGRNCYCQCKRYEPDVSSGDECYNHLGWFTMNGSGQKGPVSIWFK